MKITVTSPSFSKNPALQKELNTYFDTVQLNASGTRLKNEALINHIKDATGLVVGLERIDESVLLQCPNLKIIAKYGVGLDNIDLAACKKHNIAIGWVGGVNRLSVAEMTLGFMLSLCRNLFVTSNLLKNGTWKKSGGVQLSGKTVGIIGVGFIGKEVIRLLKPFGCKILVNDIIDETEYYQENQLIEASKEEILTKSDIISVHTPLTPEMHYFFNKQTLSLLKPSSFIINTARGGIIHQEDLKWALQNNILAGAAMDAYEEEPPTDMELLSLPNLFCTPHIGGNAQEAVLAMGRSAIQQLRNYFNK